LDRPAIAARRCPRISTWQRPAFDPSLPAGTGDRRRAQGSRR
jgi:hypothetical protein